MTGKIQALIDQVAATGATVDAAVVAIKSHVTDGATPEEVAKLTEAIGQLKEKTDTLTVAMAPPVA